MADMGVSQPKPNRWREIAAVFGPALFWAWCLLVLSGIEGPFFGELPLSFLGTVAMLLLIGVAIGASRFFVEPVNRRLLLLTVPFATFGLTASSLISSASLSQGFILFTIICKGLGIGGSMLLWGLWFALMDAKMVVAAVTKTAALAVGMFLALVALSAELAIAVGGLLPVLSGVAFLLAPQTPSGHVPKMDAGSAKRAFYAKRIAFGLAIGLVGSFVALGRAESVRSGGTSLTGLLAAAVAIAVFSGLAISRKGHALDVKYLPALPLLASGLLLVPFLGADSRLILQIAYASGWLCWMIMSAIELSAVKIRLGLDETILSFSEKLVVMAAWLTGSLLGQGVIGLTDVVWSSFVTIVVIVFAYLVVFAATLSLVGHVTKNEPILVPQGFKEQLAAACERIAAEHQLTMREQEVLSLLASGRSRPYIEATLHISTGTAKTHILHIYDKMGVHDREQLLDLAQKYMKELPKNTSVQK